MTVAAFVCVLCLFVSSQGLLKEKWKTIRVKKDDFEGHELITSHWITKLNLIDILMGAALDKEKNEAKQAAERLHAAESGAFATLLWDHHALVEHAEVRRSVFDDCKETIQTEVDAAKCLMDSLSEHDKTAVVTKLTEALEATTKLIKSLMKDRWQEGLRPGSSWKEITKHAEQEDNLISLDIDKLEEMLEGMKQAHTMLKRVFDFYRGDAKDLSDRTDDLNKEAQKLIATGCLLVGLTDAQTVTEARKVALKQKQRLQSVGITLSSLTPPLLGTKAIFAYDGFFALED